MTVVYRLRIPVVRRGSLSGSGRRRPRRRLYRNALTGRFCRRRSSTGGLRCGRRRRGMKGGFLPAVLAPIIAAAVGAVPAIASVALQAKALNQNR